MGMLPRENMASKTDAEIDLKPFINFLVVLIPVLMLSAEFAKISLITLNLPEGRGSQTDSTVKTPPENEDENKLLLSMLITDSVVTLAAKGGFLPSMFYEEYHRYVDKTDKLKYVDFKVDPKNPKKVPINPKTGKPFAVNERQEINLVVVDEVTRQFVECMYYKRTGDMIIDAQGNPVKSVSVGDRVNLNTNPRRAIDVTSASDFELRKLSAYDQMKNNLIKVKDRFRDSGVEDLENIIIVAENQVAYDKIIQLMDVAKIAEFPNIQVAKFREVTE